MINQKPDWDRIHFDVTADESYMYAATSRALRGAVNQKMKELRKQWREARTLPAPHDLFKEATE